MRKGISGAFLVFGLLIGCGGRNSEAPQSSLELKTEPIVGKNGEVLWQTTVIGLDGDKEKGTLDKKGSAAKR